MSLSEIKTEVLKQKLSVFEKKLNEYIKTSNYKWLMDNKEIKDKNTFISYKAYKNYLNKLFKERKFYHELKANIQSIEYELYVREVTNNKVLKK